MNRGTGARGDLDEQLDQGGHGQFARILIRRVVLQKGFQHRLVEQPFQGAPDHDSQRKHLAMLDNRDR